MWLQLAPIGILVVVTPKFAAELRPRRRLAQPLSAALHSVSARALPIPCFGMCTAQSLSCASSILASGVTGIIINAGSTDVVQRLPPGSSTSGSCRPAAFTYRTQSFAASKERQVPCSNRTNFVHRSRNNAVFVANYLARRHDRATRLSLPIVVAVAVLAQTPLGSRYHDAPGWNHGIARPARPTSFSNSAIFCPRIGRNRDNPIRRLAD